MSTQWHPIFARLLNIQLGEFYEIQTEVPVSDLPRAGDFLIVRRQPGPEPPFRGLWNYLTDWNVLEFKGRTDDPETDDLEKLAHVGTGITYKLNEERRAKGEQRLDSNRVSFWYIARSLGDTFLAEARLRSSLKYEGGGLYCGRCWGHPVFLVSSRDAPVEEDTIPLWLVEGNPAPHGLSDLMVHRLDLLRRFAPWLLQLQPSLYQEVRNMARESGVIDWVAVTKALVGSEDLDQVPPEEVIAILGPQRTAEALGPKRAVEAFGAERVIEEVGIPKTIETIGVDRVIQELPQLTPEQLQELLKRQQQSPPKDNPAGQDRRGDETA